MAHRKETSPLVAAATALEDELRAFDDLARVSRQQRMNSQKALTRAAGVLAESENAQARIEECVRGLVAEIAGAQQRQQESIGTLVEVASELERRAKERDDFLLRFGVLGGAAARVNALASELATRRQDGAPAAEILERLQAIQVQMTGVATEAEVLSTAAEKSDWPDIARQADAVRQQVNAVKIKLTTLHRNIAANAPS